MTSRRCRRRTLTVHARRRCVSGLPMSHLIARPEWFAMVYIMPGRRACGGRFTKNSSYDQLTTAWDLLCTRRIRIGGCKAVTTPPDPTQLDSTQLDKNRQFSVSREDFNMSRTSRLTANWRLCVELS